MTTEKEYVYADDRNKEFSSYVIFPRIGSLWELYSAEESWRSTPEVIPILGSRPNVAREYSFAQASYSFPQGTVALILEKYSINWYICLIGDGKYAVNSEYLRKEKNAYDADTKISVG
ncbi:MAG: hypothetical protein WC761_01360 [Candidatus Paceibacterota bacterium]|jgi:hypothetical protein